MQSSLDKLEAVLETKIVTLVDALEKADPVTPRYKDLCLNLDVTMAIHINLQNRKFQMMASQGEPEMVINGTLSREDVEEVLNEAAKEAEVEILKEEE